MKKDSYVSVFVEDLTVNVCIGLKAWEQKPQRLTVTVALYADPVSYLSHVGEASIVDYDRIHRAISEWPARPHTNLIESYIRELLDLAFSFKNVEAADIKISKPDIYPDAADAGVEVFMKRADYKKLK